MKEISPLRSWRHSGLPVGRQVEMTIYSLIRIEFVIRRTMKIISLNTFAGHLFEAQMVFIQEHSNDTDVFCFQEVMSSETPDFSENNGKSYRLNLYEEVQKRLPNHVGYYFCIQTDHHLPEGVADIHNKYGIAVFVHKDHEVKGVQDIFLCNAFNSFSKDRGYASLAAPGQFVEIVTDGRSLMIANIHGISMPPDKLDAPERILQSEKILEMVKDFHGEVVVMGDFNLLPEAKSISMFEDAGYRDLIKEYKIKTTRGVIMHQLFPEYEHGPYGFQEFADYAFVSKGVEVKNFEVPEVAISDHLPMILEISV